MNYILDMPNDEGKRNVVAKLLLPVPVILDKHCFYAGITFAVQQKCKSVKWMPVGQVKATSGKSQPLHYSVDKKDQWEEIPQAMYSLLVEATAITIL